MKEGEKNVWDRIKDSQLYVIAFKFAIQIFLFLCNSSRNPLGSLSKRTGLCSR